MSGIRSTIEEFMTSLPARDWPRMARTLAADVRREGAEGPDDDAVVGREPYLAWLAGIADPLHEYAWTVERIIYADTGKSAIVEASTRYRLHPDSEPFGYRLVMVFDLNPDNLIARVDLFWKTPKRRLEHDTISTGRIMDDMP